MHSKRPDILQITDTVEFESWYWLKQELVDFCKARGLPCTGRKASLLARISCHLNGKLVKAEPRSKPISTFNWAKASLSGSTVITDSVSFGKNFRSFMASLVGPKFVCHSDFMDWVRANTGATLKDAAEAWITLEKRKDDPSFKRKIADQNMLAQYTRDFFTDNPDLSRQQMITCWKNKKSLPTVNGKVTYDKRDLQWLD